ncbi:hypothetical protein [Leptothoe kymatousa]|uniref:Uncharacterized protein n=1 Tax=Leptothoe kymatousa TAU-MAC 1615 TaxID=2364775 RepID=A0ABS5Y117_9CYAN|nr:hypothetical protein [Leptothoe kymatousa]MBT9311203.1 hypothetical protein [Leptothoe kymatousa TAU-MAC 1615]
MASTFQLGLSKPSTTVYHIHLLTHQEAFLFGDTSGECTHLNPSGQIAVAEWQQLAIAHRRDDIRVGLWAVLPNGLRAIIAVTNREGTLPPNYGVQTPVKPRVLSSFVAGFKTAAAKRINLVRGEPGAPVWQRGYQEQRIEDGETLTRIRQLLTKQAQAAGIIQEAR